MKPKHQGGYSPSHTDYCERTLVTLLRGLGPWKSSIYLVGGLVPKYLFSDADGAEASLHIGTTDVDIVLNLEILADVEAYRQLEKNLESMRFKRGTNDDGREQNHCWVRAVNDKVTIVLDLLCEGEEGGRLLALPKSAGRLSAVKIPGAHLVFDDYVEIKITTELLDEGGVASETVRIAGLTSFLVLKAIAYTERYEEKDAYDIVFALSHFEGGPEAAAKIFSGKMRDATDEDQKLFQRAIDALHNRFATDNETPGYRKDGPTSYARFLADPGNREQDPVNKRNAAAVVELFLKNLQESIKT